MWTDSWLSRLFTVALLLVAAVAFGAASCDGKKKRDATRVDGDEPYEDVASVDERGRDDPEAAEVVFEKKEPDTVGPKGPAIFALSSLKGYTEPCGCTLDVMLGGIDRIVGYVTQARELYPATEVVHAGDLFFEHAELGPHEIPQEKARVDVIVEGLKALGVRATVPGERDLALGAPFFLEKLEASGVQAIGANIEIAGKALDGSLLGKLGELSVAYVGVADPSTYEGVEDISAGEPNAALARELEAVGTKAEVVVLLVQGDLEFAKQLLAKHPQVDFAVVGHDPRETDQTDAVAGGHTLEPYDQGRYLGILKLWPNGEGDFVNARTGSKSELEKVERQIEHVNKQIGRLPPATPGKEPAILLRLRKRLQELKRRREEIKKDEIEVPPDVNAFVWRTIPLEPGYPEDEAMQKVRSAYNKQLEALAKQVEREVVPPVAGQPFFVGTQECAKCHTDAYAFWQETAHARAMATLEERDKAFDQSCIGCHVVGYEQPGGSVLGKLEYEAQIPVDANTTIPVKKDLRNVGCESCHGPGSMHRMQPLDDTGKPQHILDGRGAETCASGCHVPEHSPRFNYDVYVEQITGEGHGG